MLSGRLSRPSRGDGDAGRRLSRSPFGDVGRLPCGEAGRFPGGDRALGGDTGRRLSGGGGALPRVGLFGVFDFGDFPVGDFTSAREAPAMSNTVVFQEHIMTCGASNEK